MAFLSPFFLIRADKYITIKYFKGVQILTRGYAGLVMGAGVICLAHLSGEMTSGSISSSAAKARGAIHWVKKRILDI